MTYFSGNGIKIICCMIVFSLHHIFITQSVFAETKYLINDNFDQGTAEGWEPHHVSGNTTNHLWHVYDGKYGINTNTNYGVGNTVKGLESWTDYIYEVDMYPKSIVDANIIFRYSRIDGIERFYEIHTYNGYEINLAEYNGLLDQQYKTTFAMNHDNGYRFRIVAVGNHIKIYAKEINESEYTKIFDVIDDTPLLYGKVGLRLALKNSGQSVLYFDNVTLMDLAPTPTPTPTPTLTPTPTPTPFPYFSQIDPTWKDEPYNHINATIGQVGCALTSAAMVLTANGIDKVPKGDELIDLTPRTLNDWLNADSHKRWGRQGALNWLALTELARDLSASSSADYTKIEFKLYQQNPEKFSTTINNLLTSHVPLIFKETHKLSPSGKHFFVSSWFDEPTNTYTIHDPYAASRQYLSGDEEVIETAYHYYPTQSDFSFIWINADTGIPLTITDPVGKHTSLISRQIPQSTAFATATSGDSLSNAVTAHTFSQYTIKHPLSGYYDLSFAPKEPGYYDFEVFMYDELGNSQAIKRRAYFVANPTQFTLIYDHENINIGHVVMLHLFEPLYHTLTQGLASQLFIDEKSFRHLYRFLTTTEKVYYQDNNAGIQLVHVFKQHVDNDLQQNKLSPVLHEQIINQIDILLPLL
jgi:hypothetical protein